MNYFRSGGVHFHLELRQTKKEHWNYRIRDLVFDAMFYFSEGDITKEKIKERLIELVDLMKERGVKPLLETRDFLDLFLAGEAEPAETAETRKREERNGEKGDRLREPEVIYGADGKLKIKADSHRVIGSAAPDDEEWGGHWWVMGEYDSLEEALEIFEAAVQNKRDCIQGKKFDKFWTEEGLKAALEREEGVLAMLKKEKAKKSFGSVLGSLELIENKTIPAERIGADKTREMAVQLFSLFEQLNPETQEIVLTEVGRQLGLKGSATREQFRETAKDKAEEIIRVGKSGA